MKKNKRIVSAVALLCVTLLAACASDTKATNGTVESPKATESPAEVTQTPEATVAPTETVAPEATATQVVEPTAEPTATPTPEPTATPTPEPTATPMPEPTATPTPEPTVQETNGIQTLEVKEAKLGEGREIVVANGGVIIFTESVLIDEDGWFYHEERYGAMDYDYNVIVEAKNEYRTYPDENGYFAMAYTTGYDETSDSMLYVINLYDKHGNVILTEGTDKPVSTFSMNMPQDGVYVYNVGYESWYGESATEDYAIFAAFDAEQKEYLYKHYPTYSDSVSLIDCSATHLVYETYDYDEGESVYVIVDFKTGEKKNILRYKYIEDESEAALDYTISMKSAPQDGYMVVTVDEIYSYSEDDAYDNGASDFYGDEYYDEYYDGYFDDDGYFYYDHYANSNYEYKDYYGIVSADGSVAYLIEINDLEDITNDYYDNIVWGSGYGIDSIANKEMKMVLDGNHMDALMDFSKTTSTTEIEALNGTLADKVIYVTDIENVFVAEYNTIGMSAFGWYLIEKDGLWCYMDENYNVVDNFDDCANFWREYSAVVDDGKIYIVNQKLEKVLEVCEGTGLSCSGDKYNIQTANGTKYFILIEK